MLKIIDEPKMREDMID